MLAALPALAALAAAAAACAGDESTGIENKSAALAHSLRRQLMTNNYDYMSSESKHDTTKQFKGKSRKNYRSYDYDNIYNIDDKQEEEIHSDDKSYKPKKHLKRDKHHVVNDNTEEVSDRSDVSYPEPLSIDEDLRRIVRGKTHRKKLKKPLHRRVDNDNNYKPESGDDDKYISSEVTNHHTDVTTTALYKVLKKKKSYRRSGAPTLIQEETPDGVSVVNLGGGPFPQFRLPEPRRQYMHGAGEVGGVGENEEEVLPPPLEYNVTEDTEILNSFQNKNNMTTEFKSSTAQLSVTDDIYVL